MRTQNFCAALAVVCMLPISPALAGADPLRFEDKAEWQAAAGDFTSIDFTGFAAGTIITDQYADQGVTFFNGIDTIFFSPTAFPNDDWGLDGNGDIWVQFDQPMHWIAADWPGAFFEIDLYLDGQLLSETLFAEDGSLGHFSGLFSPEPFDVAVLIDPTGAATIDDLFFAVPAPSGLLILLLPLLSSHRRRR